MVRVSSYARNVLTQFNWFATYARPTLTGIKDIAWIAGRGNFSRKWVRACIKMKLLASMMISKAGSGSRDSSGVGKHGAVVRTCFIVLSPWLALCGPLIASAVSLPEVWSLSGKIFDLRFNRQGPPVTNVLSLAGHYDKGRFLLELTPVHVEDDLVQNAGWDGERLFLLKHFPENPGGPRNRQLGYVEPDLFSRYASHALEAVLLSFCDGNMLGQLSSNQEPVILGTFRAYPEEDNKYTVSQTEEGTYIEAWSPGYEVQDTGNVPIKGFEKGFKRWTHRSNLGALQWTNDSSSLVIEYERFRPVEGQLLKERQVSANIILQVETPVISRFQPDIKEDRLTILDYSYRDMFSQFKGMAAQNYTYIVTNHVWDFNSNIIVAHMKTRTDWLARHGNQVPSDLMDLPHNVPIYKGRRAAIIWALITIAAIPALLAIHWSGKRRGVGPK